MSDKFLALSELRAGDFDHLDGSLVEHLRGTSSLLKKWGVRMELQDAGLYHAAYGTAGFNLSLVSTSQRDKVRNIIGHSAEEIVYQYCACERKSFFSQIRQKSNPVFHNRFTGESYYLPGNMLKDFCELTAANEIEIGIDNPGFIEEHGVGLNTLFVSMAPYLTNAAQVEAARLFGVANA